jgi:hypothetical protein
MRKGTPISAKMPALMVKETATISAAPKRCSTKNQRTSTTPGTMNNIKVLKKTITSGNVAKAACRRPMRIKANALSNTI